MSRIESLRNRGAVISSALVIGMGAAACEAPGSQDSNIAQAEDSSGTVGIRVGENEYIADVDGDGIPDTVILGGAESPTPQEATPNTPESAPATLENEIYEIPFDNTRSPGYRAFDAVFSETLRTGQDPEVLGQWEGHAIFMKGQYLVVMTNPIMFLEEEYEDYYLGAINFNPGGNGENIQPSFMGIDVADETSPGAISAHLDNLAGVQYARFIPKDPLHITPVTANQVRSNAEEAAMPNELVFTDKSTGQVREPSFRLIDISPGATSVSVEQVQEAVAKAVESLGGTKNALPISTSVFAD